MSKTLCDWSKKDIEAHFERLSELVSAPAFVCRKCARAANSSKILCKPKRISPDCATAGEEGWEKKT